MEIEQEGEPDAGSLLMVTATVLTLGGPPWALHNILVPVLSLCIAVHTGLSPRGTMKERRLYGSVSPKQCFFF